MLLSEDETLILIKLLKKATPDRTETAGIYEVIITPTILSPDDFVPRKRVCLKEVNNCVGETKV